jgi:hypothetical protein
VTGGREKIRNGGLHNLYSSRNITRENEWKRMRWTGDVECVQ